MAMQAATVGILIEKAKFDPQVALAIAEAIDNERQESQLVTIPVLDARLADLKSELVRWVFLATVGQVTMLTGIMYSLLQHAR